MNDKTYNTDATSFVKTVRKLNRLSQILADKILQKPDEPSPQATYVVYNLGDPATPISGHGETMQEARKNAGIIAKSMRETNGRKL